MVVIFCSVTPIASAIFTKSQIQRTILSTATTTSEFKPLDDQVSSQNSDFMMTAYGHLWLEQDLPAFTTVDAAIVPFEIESSMRPQVLNETWTAATKMYSTSLSCEPATTIKSNNDLLSQGYDNGKGCVITPGSITFKNSPPFAGLYIGYYMDQQSDYGLSTETGCTALNNSNTFLAIWGTDLASPAPNITALFCEPAYWIQNVNVTVTVPKMTVSNIAPLASPVPLTSDVFNISNYNYAIGTGATTSSQRSDIPRTTAFVDQYPRLQKMGLNSSITNMVGFALGASRLELHQYLDTGKLAESYEKAHKLLFALAVRDFFAPSAHAAYPRLGIVQGKTNTVVVLRVLAIITEALLGLITVFALGLLWYSWNRQSQLIKDPASLTDLVSMLIPSTRSGGLHTIPTISGGGTAAKTLAGKNQVHRAVLESSYKNVRKSKELLAHIQNGKMYVAASGCELKQPLLSRIGPETKQEIFDRDGGPINSNSKLFRPVEMSSAVAGVFIFVLLIALTILAVL